MKKMTMGALSLLLHWAGAQRPGSEASAVNVLCCDFVDVSRFCSLVIGLNYKLLAGDGALAACPLCRTPTESSSDVSNRTGNPASKKRCVFSIKPHLLTLQDLSPASS
ncbi:PI-PLC X domain-containing protein 1-like [Plectropomus leopardus]|uniref:PI-PLC X domain-containing protein 1-like n=1 Tax=Plectropomus leopardus TaxID=160734 RepID=UPI001C4C5A4E|nr:PI-PLC X domain-containing protein 1-like [Plectropomus leopardus]